jgi:hypothetical protein
MAIRADSYGSAAEVLAFTRHLLGGQADFNSTTRPTATEVEKFIDRASSHLNIAMVGKGLQTPVTNTTGKLILDDWVVARATEYVELTQRGVGYSEGEGSRVSAFRNLQKAAKDFVAEVAPGLRELGVTQTRRASDGLAFTGISAQDQRSDRDDTTLEQPMFSRHQFNEPTATHFVTDQDYEVDDD